MNNNYGKRIIKKSQLKMALLQHMIDSLEGHVFDEVKVQYWCEKAQISEVTFFKYFEKKEELLQFYMQVWNYNRELRIQKEGRSSGLEGIRAIFDDISETKYAINILNSLSTFIGRSKEPPKKLILTDCDRWLLNNTEIIEPLQLEDQFRLHLSEAVKEGILENDLGNEKLILLLSSLFYGTPLIAHATGYMLKELYRNHLDIVLGFKKR